MKFFHFLLVPNFGLPHIWLMAIGDFDSAFNFVILTSWERFWCNFECAFSNCLVRKVFWSLSCRKVSIWVLFFASRPQKSNGDVEPDVLKERLERSDTGQSALSIKSANRNIFISKYCRSSSTKLSYSVGARGIRIASRISKKPFGYPSIYSKKFPSKYVFPYKYSGHFKPKAYRINVLAESGFMLQIARTSGSQISALPAEILKKQRRR